MTASTHAAGETWHLVTCEFPPRLGGVADFTATAASALAAAGLRVHVWTPGPAGARDGITVHALADTYSSATIAALDAALDAAPRPRRIFVQWVPHGYGRKSLNLPFCRWARRRAARGDRLDVMVHEPFLPFTARRARQNVGAVIHRAMLATLLGRASRVYVSTPSYARDVAAYWRRSSEEVRWLPLSTPVPLVCDPAAVSAARSRLAGDAPLVAHFGTCDALVAPALGRVLSGIVAARPDAKVALMGRDTETFAAELERSGVPAGTIVARGPLPAPELSVLIQAADVFVQPYPDGVSARRTTLMALLSHGRAVVTWAGRRTDSFWAESGAVLLAPATQVSSIVDGALALLSDPERARALGETARACYHERFGVDRLVSSLLDGDASGPARGHA